MPTQQYDLKTPENYSYDSDKIEILNDEAKLKAIVSGAEAALYCKLDKNNGLVAVDSSGNDRHGAFQGGYTEDNWTTGKIGSAIVGISITNGFINFDQLLSYERTDSFSLECWFKTSSSAVMDFISKVADTGANQGFILNMLSGKMRTVIRDVNGNIISLITVLTYNDNDWHHVVFTYDGTNLVTGCNLYIDNVLDSVVESSDTLDSTITTTADLQISGRDGNNVTIDSDTIIDEVVIYSRELTPAEIAFRWNNGDGTQQIPGATTSFATDNPTVISKGFLTTTGVLDFSSTIVTTGLDDVRFVIDVDGVNFYFDGLSWVESIGFSESNSIAEITSNISTLITSGISSIRFVAYLHSNDGSSTPVLQDVFFEFNFFGSLENVDKTLVQGNIFDIDGVVNADPIYVSLNKKSAEYKDSIQISGDIKTINVAVDGSWQIELADTDDIEDLNTYYQFVINGKIFNKKVPKTGTINFNELPEAY